MFDLGAPVPADAQKWSEIREVVSGRVVNAYASQDWVLAFLYRGSSMHYRNNIAGLNPIRLKGVESICLDGTIKSHACYGKEFYGLLSMMELGQPSRLSGSRHEIDDGFLVPNQEGEAQTETPPAVLSAVEEVMAIGGVSEEEHS